MSSASKRPTNSPRRYVQKTKISLGIFALLILIAHRSATKTPTRDEENENVRVDSNKRDARSRFTVVRFEFCVAFASSRGRFHSPEICLFLFTQSERSPLPTQKLKKKSQSVSFVAASVIALNAAPALAVSPIEIQDKRVENAGGLQLIYEVRLSSFARYRTAVVYECFRFVFPSFTKARSALFFVGRRRRKGMISRIKKSIFDTTFCLKKKRE